VHAPAAVVNIHTNQVVRIIGKDENTTRFLNLSLYQGAPKKKNVVLTLVRQRALRLDSGEYG